MKKIICFLCSLVFLVARENPFESLMSPNIDTNIDEEKKADFFESFDFKLPSTARILKEIKVIYQTIDGGIEEKVLPINRNIDWHYPLSLSQKDALIQENSDYISVSKMIFFAKDNKLFITTNRTMEISFILPEPFRIIIDFNKQDIDVDKTNILHQKYFSSINLIKHRDFYRIIITLDGHYEYQITKTDDGYQIQLQ